MAEGRFHHRLWAHLAVFGQNILLQRAAVYPDADRDVPLAAGIGHRLYTVLTPDISGIDPDLVGAGRNGFQSQPIIKVDIHHHRQRTALLDFSYRMGRRLVRDSHPDDIAPGGSQSPYLGESGIHIICTGIGHRLDGNRRPAAYRYASYTDLSGHVTNPPFPDTSYLPNSLPTSLRVTTSIRHISAARPAMWTYPSYLGSILFRNSL